MKIDPNALVAALKDSGGSVTSTLGYLPQDDQALVLTEAEAATWEQEPGAITDEEHDKRCQRGYLYADTDGTMTHCPVCAYRQLEADFRKRLENSGIGSRYLDVEWGDLKIIDPLPRIKASVTRIKELRASGANALLTGPPGTGKTQAAVLILKAAIRAGLTARIENLGSLGMDIRDGYGAGDTTESGVVKSLSALDILALDDIGAGETGGAKIEQRILYMILEARQNNRRPVVLTTNLSAHELAAAVGQRIINRLAPLSIINFDHGRNFRKADEGAEGVAAW